MNGKTVLIVKVHWLSQLVHSCRWSNRNTGFCKSSSSSGTFDVGGSSLQLWIEDTHNKQCFSKELNPSIFPLLQWQTLYIVVLYSKSYVHLTKVGKMTVLDNNNPSPTCTFAYASLHTSCRFHLTNRWSTPSSRWYKLSAWSGTMWLQCLMSHPDLRTLLMLGTTGASLKTWFKPILSHSLISADVILKTLIYVAYSVQQAQIYWRKPFDIGCSVLYI